MSHRRVVLHKLEQSYTYYRTKDGYWSMMQRGISYAHDIHRTGPCCYDTTRPDFVTTWKNLYGSEDCDTLERMFLSFDDHYHRVQELHYQWERRYFISLLPGVEIPDDVSTVEIRLMVLLAHDIDPEELEREIERERERDREQEDDFFMDFLEIVERNEVL